MQLLSVNDIKLILKEAEKNQLTIYYTNESDCGFGDIEIYLPNNKTLIITEVVVNCWQVKYKYEIIEG